MATMLYLFSLSYRSPFEYQFFGKYNLKAEIIYVLHKFGSVFKLQKIVSRFSKKISI